MAAADPGPDMAIDVPDPDDRAPPSLTPEQSRLLAQFLADPEARARMVEAVQKTYLNPDFWKSISDTIRATYLNPDVWRGVGDLINRTYLDPDMWRNAVATIREAYSSEVLRDALAQLRDGFETEAEALDAELAKAIDADPHVSPDASLGWWLATRSGQAQLGIMVAGLAVLDRAIRLAEELTGVEPPAGLNNAIDLVFAMVAFLVLWQTQTRPPSDG